jgi:signal transduction histidine kinase
MHDTLRVLPYFADVSDELLDRVSDLSTEVEFVDGTVIIEEGSQSLEMYVVVSGELLVTKQTGGKEVELGRIGPGEVFGEIALLDEAPRTASVTARGVTRAICVPAGAFEELLGDPRVVRRMFRTVTSRLRGIEDTLRHEERMAALGKMAAQLMHELNNPAAAVARSTGELARIQEELSEAASALGAGGAPTLLEPAAPALEMSALARGEAEEGVAGWLTDLGVSGAWDLAPALVAAGWTTSDLDSALADTDDDIKVPLVRWVGLTTAARQLVEELGIGAGRISELVRVVREYSFLDRGPIQEIDPTAGIRDTLVLLKHKLGAIEVVLDFDDPLAKVEASGRDLNQVWTNLIDNASDVMSEGGTLTITARNSPQHVVIDVGDTGPGIPEDVADKIFDPFFTTKEPGKGTGLGLHTVHTIVSRIGGEITVASNAGGTRFTVTLPVAAGS